MVSVYPNPPQEQGYFNSFNYMGGGDPMVYGSGLEDPNKKVRKPYTITKSRESWSEQEHDKFLEALHLFDRDWKKIEAFVGSKTVIQIRSHAQKYFMKVQKNGTSEHVPPPRPKRKAAHPYPQKAPKIVVPNQPLQSSAALLDSAYNVTRPESVMAPRNPLSNANVPPWTYNIVTPVSSSSDFPKDSQRFPLTHNFSSGSNDDSESNPPRVWTCNEASPLKEKEANREIMPDFAQVYSFIGSVFDPSTSNHMQRLKEMDPTDVETALMMMKNLSVNLASPEFEAHQRKLLSSSIN